MLNAGSIVMSGGSSDLDLGALGQRRDLLYFLDLARREGALYQPTAIGAAWAVLSPLLTVLVDAEVQRDLRARGSRRLKDFDLQRMAKTYRAVCRAPAGCRGAQRTNGCSRRADRDEGRRSPTTRRFGVIWGARGRVGERWHT
jgi:hypothetical protein